MDRDNRRDDRPQRRPDTREHQPRNDRDRSRSPQNRDRRDDRRRDRSPYRGPTRGGGAGGGRGRGGRGGAAGAPYQHNNDRDFQRQPPNNNQNSRGGNNFQPQPSRHHNNGPPSKPTPAPTPQIDLSPLEGEDEDATLERVTAAIQGVMGFGKFRSTQNTKVPGNDKNYAVSRVKKAEYRQYMNRVGGFNRPLSPGKM